MMMKRLAVFTARLLPKLLAFLLVVSVHLFVHECGHYTAARALDVTVAEFHVGSGPVLYQRELPDGAEFRFALYPTRGHVLHMGGNLPASGRAAIAVAGMAATALMVFLMYLAIFFVLPSGIPWHRSLWSAFRLSFLEWLLFPFRLMWAFMTLRPLMILERAWAMMLFIFGKDFTLGKTVVGGASLALLACVNVAALLNGWSLLPSLDFSSDCDALGSLLFFSCLGADGLSIWMYLVLFFHASIWVSLLLYAIVLPFRIWKDVKRARSETDETGENGTDDPDSDEDRRP